MNYVHVAGHLGADPETRFTSAGQKVTTLRVASNSRKGGKEETIWWRITIWGERFDKMMTHLKKGSAIIAVGQMHKPEIYTDKEGRSQVSVEMTAEMLSFSPFGKGEREGGSQQPYAGASQFKERSAPQPFSSGSSSSSGFDSGFQSSTYGQGHLDEDPLPF